MQKVQKNSALSILAIFILILLTACGGDACIDEPTLETDLKTSDVVIAEQTAEQEVNQEADQEEDQEEDKQSVEQEADQEESAVEKLEDDNPSPVPVPTSVPSPTPVPEPTQEEVPTPTEIPESAIESILVDTYTWGQSQKTRTLQQVLALSVDGYYGSDTRSAHIAELQERGLSIGNVPEMLSTPTPTPTPTPAPTPTPTPAPTPTPTPAPTPTPTPAAPTFSPAVVTFTTKSCSDVKFIWSNPDSTPDSWQVTLDVRANVGSGNPPASLWVSKTHTIDGTNGNESFTSLEFHGQNVWVTLWGNGAPYSVVISRVDSGIVGSPSTASTGAMWDDC